MMDRDEHTAEPTPDEADEVDEDEEDEVPAEGAAPGPQVPSSIAIIRIIAVLGMGLSISFGLFIMLVGLKGVIVGIPIVLLSIPCYYGMRVAERLAARHEQSTPPDA